MRIKRAWKVEIRGVMKMQYNMKNKQDKTRIQLQLREVEKMFAVYHRALASKGTKIIVTF